MDKKLYLIKDMTTRESLQAAFTDESRALTHAQEITRFTDREAVLAIIEWDELKKSGRGVALVHQGVIFRPITQ
jgi:hypothetical protein